MSPAAIRRMNPAARFKLRAACILAAFCGWSSLANAVAYVNYAISRAESDAEAMGREPTA